MMRSVNDNLEYTMQQNAAVLVMLLLPACLNRIKWTIKETGKQTEMLDINYINFKKNNEHLCYALKQRYTNEKRYD
jgi:hypothetical protein